MHSTCSITCNFCSLESHNCNKYHEEFCGRTSSRLRAGRFNPAISATSSCWSIASFTWTKAMWTEMKTMLINSKHSFVKMLWKKVHCCQHLTSCKNQLKWKSLSSRGLSISRPTLQRKPLALWKPMWEQFNHSWLKDCECILVLYRRGGQNSQHRAHKRNSNVRKQSRQ